MYGFVDPAPGFTPEWPEEFKEVPLAELKRRLQNYLVYEKNSPGEWISDIFKLRDRIAILENYYTGYK
jgi:hypothetical protein